MSENIYPDEICFHVETEDHAEELLRISKDEFFYKGETDWDEVKTEYDLIQAKKSKLSLQQIKNVVNLWEWHITGNTANNNNKGE